MAREDIKLNTTTHDIVLKAEDYTCGSFAWSEKTKTINNTEYKVGEITLSSLSKDSFAANGGYVHIDYTPSALNMLFQVNVKSSNNAGAGMVTIPSTATYFATTDSSLTACGLYAINSNGNYYIRLINESTISFYSADDWDFPVITANNQNANLLLQCVPTNNYRYPTTGVGLVRWINGNDDVTGLTDRIQSEFTADGVNVRSAIYDSETNDLKVDIDEDSIVD